MTAAEMQELGADEVLIDFFPSGSDQERTGFACGCVRQGQATVFSRRGPDGRFGPVASA